jgi:hypothetical protein
VSSTDFDENLKIQPQVVVDVMGNAQICIVDQQKQLPKKL